MIFVWLSILVRVLGLGGIVGDFISIASLCVVATAPYGGTPGSLRKVISYRDRS